MTPTLRMHLSAPGLLKAVQKVFSKLPDPRDFSKPPTIPIRDHLMSGLAVFGLKHPSLLDYDRRRSYPHIAHNLRTLYGVEAPPSDTYLRERLDLVDPDLIRPAFKRLFALLQRGKGLEAYEYIDGRVLISGDGTGHFSSSNVSCPQCCQKVSQKGQVTYYHQMFGACVVHPDRSQVIPLCPEVILNRDGGSKNDCERNACKRFLGHFRREHPHLRAIFLADGLSSTGPNVRMLQQHGLKYILVAKPGDHGFLFEQLERDDVVYHEVKTEDGYFHQFRFLNSVPINRSNLDTEVNFLEYRQTDKKGKETNFSWITNISLSKGNVFKISKAGRARWKIENETFNTLKNFGYNLEHNYGHGQRYLATVLCMLMVLAFLIDQIQGACCSVFQRCKAEVGTFRNLWRTIRTLFEYVYFSDWMQLFSVINRQLDLDTS